MKAAKFVRYLFSRMSHHFHPQDFLLNTSKSPGER